MSLVIPFPFQEDHILAVVARLRALKTQYGRLGETPDARALKELREHSACVMLQAPTGIGKTLIACEVMNRFSAEEPLLWFWFAPFAGLVGQAQRTLAAQASRLPQLDVEAGRRPERLEPGAVFVLTWQTVAARSKESRIARQSGDAGLALDELVTLAREQGFRIGVVVDEAHHGFIRAPAACQFFAQVLAPDYVLLMTATPRDEDAERFSALTGYRLGGPSEWASITRAEGVSAQLLKRSVKAARFVTRNIDESQLVSFEEVALCECAAMHRLLQKRLEAAQVGVSPLMLVQVPNGGEALTRARTYLIETLHFDADSVKAHTADEPDPNLAALTDDPSVEVILFKMAIATGFDAPRAFTLAALRGARDRNFGIQVVGRIMRVHRLLQGRLDTLAPELSYGYVFLANSEAQEGLVGAAGEINRMPDHLVSAATSALVTVFADQVMVQCVGEGETLALPMDVPFRPDAPVSTARGATPGSAPVHSARLFSDLFRGNERAGKALFAHGNVPETPLSRALALDAPQSGRAYRRRATAPATLVTEVLPELTDDFEEQLVSHINFSSAVLADRLRVRSRVVERMTDVFKSEILEDREIQARMSPALIAEQAKQVAFKFEGVDRRSFGELLKQRFKTALEEGGYELPASNEELNQQLELVLVRNPTLVREAYRRVRSERVTAKETALPAALESEVDLEAAAKNIYGVFPPISASERQFAETLDTAEGVLWWHRNPVRKAHSVALYRWHDGVGFFPDFVVAVIGREQSEGIALTELKGPQLLEYDREKAGAVHIKYGRVFMVGRQTAEGPYRLWRLAEGRLVDDGPFEVQRLRFG